MLEVDDLVLKDCFGSKNRFRLTFALVFFIVLIFDRLTFFGLRTLCEDGLNELVGWYVNSLMSISMGQRFSGLVTASRFALGWMGTLLTKYDD